MAYQCNECGCTFTAASTTGSCPACGAFSIIRPANNEKMNNATPAGKWRLILLVSLWSFLIVAIYQKLQT